MLTNYIILYVVRKGTNSLQPSTLSGPQKRDKSEKMCSQLSHNFILCPPHITSPNFTSPLNSNSSASHRIMTLQNPKSTCDVYSTTVPQRMTRVSVSPSSAIASLDSPIRTLVQTRSASSYH